MLEKISDRIYYMMNSDETDRPILGIVIGDDSCLIVDAGNSPKHADEFKMELAKMELPPIKYLVVTHYHWDHTLGLNAWDLVTIANHKTSEYIDLYRSTKYDDVSLEIAKEKGIYNDYAVRCIKTEITAREDFSPSNIDMSFDGDIKIDLGGITCEIRQIVSPHTDDSTIVYIPQEKTIFLGDCIYGSTKKGFGYFNDKLLFPMIDIINKYNANYYVCSHESICSKEEIESYWEQLNIGYNLANNCSCLGEALVEYKNQFDIEASDDMIYFLKSFGLR